MQRTCVPGSQMVERSQHSHSRLKIFNIKQGENWAYKTGTDSLLLFLLIAV